MNGFNLSEWAIRHKTLIIYFMMVCVGAGLLSYRGLGREEDPPFPILTMIVQTNWPGATVHDTAEQITDRIAKKLEETPSLDYIKSYTEPGVSVIYVNLLDSTDPNSISEIWYEVRKKVGDIMSRLPPGVQGPYFNDEFGDVFGIIYGLTFDGFTPREARDFAETARSAFLRVPYVDKVDIFGDQAEKIYLSFSPQRLAALGVRPEQMLHAIAEQNAVQPAGVLNTSTENMLIEVSGALASEKSLEETNFYINGRFFKLGDIAIVQRGYVDPPSKMFRANGKPAIGIGISMRPGGNVLEFGAGLRKVAADLEQRFPIGIDLALVSDQPGVVKEAIGGFTEALWEAIAIVLVVSFLSLGVRAGLVVAISIPLVLMIVFFGMNLADISLQRISLGALIIALGLLVDDAMITVEMMISKIEGGFEKAKAATFAYVTTAFPMLTGTLVTVAGFVPIGFAHSGTGHYCFSLFAVVGIALVVSWFVAVTFAPVVGVLILPAKLKAAHEGEAEKGRFLRAFRAVLVTCMRWRYVTILVTVGLFAASLFGLNFVQKQFFPSSNRPEILVTMMLPKNGSIYETRTEVDRLQKIIQGDPQIDRYSAYIGGGAIRFYLPLDVQLDNSFIAQFVIVAKGLRERDALIAKLVALFDADFPNVLARVSRLELGPPVGWPIQYRVSAETPEETRTISDQLAAILRDSPYTETVNFDWSEKNKLIRIAIDQDKARRVGLSSDEVAKVMNVILSGVTATQIRDAIYLIDVVARAQGTERLSVETLRSLRITLGNVRSIPLSEIATIEYGLADGYLWQRDRLPTITVQADTAPGLQAPTVFHLLAKQVDALRAKLPPGALIQDGGTIEKSAQSNAAIVAEFPLMMLVMLTVLMLQLQSFQRLFLVVSVAPLGLIGVVAMLLATRTPMGFVAMLGIIALAGMIIRNSLILIVQIEDNRAEGMNPWEAVVEAAQHRLRPILLTASAAILGMIPIMRDVFWGPMAFAVVGGLAGATLLTLLFLPALYVAWFRLREPQAEAPTRTGEAPSHLDSELPGAAPAS